MKLNKKTQYGLLFVLYLLRAGRSTVENVAVNLNLSHSFLEQVARRLRLAGIVKSIKGNGGGFELMGDPTVMEIVAALCAPTNLIDSNTGSRYRKGELEHRALFYYSTILGALIHGGMRCKVRDLGTDLIKKELQQMDSVTDTGVGH